MEKFDIDLQDIEIFEYNTVIVGTGAAGLNCAIHLVEEGIAPWQIALVTEELGGGTSFNAGSDKQTYYKLSIVGDQADSPYEMAKDLVSGGAMHGDIALIESTNSIREFFHLVQLGVSFPYDQYGGFVGYKTDNDPKQRATSIGPYTSQEMCNRLLEVVTELKINIYDKYYATQILFDDLVERQAIGLICFDINSLINREELKDMVEPIKIFKARNIVLATGGPSLLYKNSVYPISQKGSTSLAIQGGCVLQNLTESQFGLASTHFRWNLSGSYQQVIPCYISINENGEEYEFLNDYFPSFKELSRAIFLKGYQWPFSSDRIEAYGSSLIDLAVYFESEISGRKVFLDFTRNPSGYDINSMDPVAKEYLKNSNAMVELPISRLKSLNDQAYLHYKDHGIDISNERLQIAVCNQHLNGGVSCDIWWESSVKHLFVIGEINGSHGIHRPGGAALNSGQVGGLRAAQKIAHTYDSLVPLTVDEFFLETENQLIEFLEAVDLCLKNMRNKEKFTPSKILESIQNRTEKYAGILRTEEGLEDEIKNIELQLQNLDTIISLNDSSEIVKYFQVKDSLLTQYLFFSAVSDYHRHRGQSRGSFLINRKDLNSSLGERLIKLPKGLSKYNFIKSDLDLTDQIQTISLQNNKPDIQWIKVRGVPKSFSWFESVWKDFNNGNIVQ
ncbi:MAG: FAD-binding protein [Promethearchaeota archaeon]|jgi:succinate dehydrogenase/fumarate reductase flavoprotein subunit